MTGVPFRVLTVCVGNICRSPLAERLLRLRLDEQVRAGTVSVDSAGVGAVVGHGVDDLALEELVRLGGSGDGFAARQLVGAHMAEAGLVLTATTDIRARALREQPSALKRTFTLGEFAAVCSAPDDGTVGSAVELVAYGAGHRPANAAELDVRDPIGRDGAVHREVADQIDGYVSVIAGRLAGLL